MPARWWRHWPAADAKADGCAWLVRIEEWTYSRCVPGAAGTSFSNWRLRVACRRAGGVAIDPGCALRRRARQAHRRRRHLPLRMHAQRHRTGPRREWPGEASPRRTGLPRNVPARAARQARWRGARSHLRSRRLRAAHRLHDRRLRAQQNLTQQVVTSSCGVPTLWIYQLAVVLTMPIRRSPMWCAAKTWPTTPLGRSTSSACWACRHRSICTRRCAGRQRGKLRSARATASTPCPMAALRNAARASAWPRSPRMPIRPQPGWRKASAWRLTLWQLGIDPAT